MNKAWPAWPLFLACMSAFNAVAENAASITATHRFSEKILYIDFSIINNSKKSFCLPKSDLPWGTAYSTTLVAVEANRAKPLERAWIIDDGIVGEECIAPGQKISGSRSLEEIFPAISNAHIKNGVVLFWRYADSDLNIEDGGYLLIKMQNRDANGTNPRKTAK